MQNIYDDGASMYKRISTYEEDRDDAEFLKSLYPPELVELQLLVEDKCNQLEYDGSIMFDEYPDKIRVHMVAEEIRRQAGEGDKNLVEIMLINEILRRRIRRRCCRFMGFC